MISLQQVILMLLNGDEVVIEDDLKEYFELKIERLDKGVDFHGATTLLIHTDRLGG